MRFNENTAVSTPRVLLVPYDRAHVLTYHKWMEDPDIREATASERLTLEEEFENQESWRASHDKLTFIICQPARDGEVRPPDDGSSSSRAFVEAGVVDSPERMVGDINFFLYPWDGSEDGDDDDSGDPTRTATTKSYVGEVDVMIANPTHRGKGVGKAAVQAFLSYIRHNLEHILAEHQCANSSGHSQAVGDGSSNGDLTPFLRQFMVKIKADNEASIGLFRGLGFHQEGPVNFFGEVKMVLTDIDSVTAAPASSFQELRYRRVGIRGV